jgi:hypothetical protein
VLARRGHAILDGMTGPGAQDLDSPQDWEWEPTQESKRQVRRLFMEWDPLGVSGYPEAADEYDCMISLLMERLAAGADARSLAKWISGRRFWHFGDASDEVRDTQLAEALTAWWERPRPRPPDGPRALCGRSGYVLAKWFDCLRGWRLPC